MPSPKMKSKISTGCLTIEKDLHVCPKSKIISKKPYPKSILSAQVKEIGTTIQNCQDVSPRTLVPPENVASDESIDNIEFLNKEYSEFPKQQSFSLDFSAPGGTIEGPGCPYTENTETIFSPIEPVEVHSQCCTQEDAVRSTGDNCMPRLRGDESDGGRSICRYETCDVSDFCLSDMTVTRLPSDGDSLDGICQINCLSDCRSSEQTIFDASNEYLILPTLEGDADVSNTCILPYEEASMVQENASFYSALCQIRSCSEDTDFKTDLDKTDCFNQQLFIKNLPELSDVESNDLSAQIPPKQSHRRKSVTLVLDLDETLVHSTLDQSCDPDFNFNVLFNMKEFTVYVKQRPNLHTFLERVSEMFEVVIFTASQSIYAKKLLDILDPDGRLISRQMYRESCIFSDGNYIKDLTVLGVDLAKVAIIDNSPQVFYLQVNNGIPIKSWFNDPLDCALMSLLPFLEILADADDVRPIIAQRFGNKE